MTPEKYYLTLPFGHDSNVNTTRNGAKLSVGDRVRYLPSPTGDLIRTGTVWEVTPSSFSVEFDDFYCYRLLFFNSELRNFEVI